MGTVGSACLGAWARADAGLACTGAVCSDVLGISVALEWIPNVCGKRSDESAVTAWEHEVPEAPAGSFALSDGCEYVVVDWAW